MGKCRFLFLVALLSLVMAGMAWSPIQAEEWHPFFGQDMIGNRAETVTLWNDGYGTLPLGLLDFDEDAYTLTGSLGLPTDPPASSLADFLVAYWNFDTDFAANYGGSAFDGDPSSARLKIGLRAYWSFDTDCTATYGDPIYDGVPSAPLDFETGKFGNAARFRRADNDYVTVSTPVLTQGQDHTYSAWYKSTVSNMADGDIYQVLQTTGAEGANAYSASYHLYGGGGNDLGDVWTHQVDGSGIHTVVSNAAGTGWHHIAVTYERDAPGGLHTIYLDGDEVETLSTTDELSEVVGMIIGGPRFLTGRNWDGWIDDVAFWDRALSADEIKSLNVHPVSGSPVSIEVAAGRFGGAARFERDKYQYVTTSTPVITPGQDHSYSVWYRATFTTIGNHTDRFFVLESTGSYPVSFGLRDVADDGLDTQGEVFTVWSGGSAHEVFDHPHENYWHNLTVTYRASTESHDIYLDGVLQGSMDSNDPLANTSGLIIGGHGNGVGRNWDGWIDDLAVWNRVLTLDEISALQTQSVLGPNPQFQQLDLASGDFDGDDRDDVVGVFGVATADPHLRDIWIVVPAVDDGEVDWDAAETTSTLFSRQLYIESGSAIAPGNLRLVAGNFDEDEESEFALGLQIIGTDDNTYVRMVILDFEEGNRHPTEHWVYSQVLNWSEIPMRDSARFDLAAFDLDQDAISELILAQSWPTGAPPSCAHYLRVFRQEEGAWIQKAKSYSTASVDNWDAGNWDPLHDFGHGTNARDRDRCAVAAGITLNELSPIPFIAMAIERRHWVADPEIIEFYLDAHMWIFLVETETNPDWTITYQNFQTTEESYPIATHWRLTGKSLGLAVGDLNFDGADEIALAAMDSVFVYGTRADYGNLEAELISRYPRIARTNDPSHRVVQIVDLDADPGRSSPDDWLPEIVFQDWTTWSTNAHLRTQVLRPQLDMHVVGEDTSWTMTGLQLVGEMPHASLTQNRGQAATISGDLDGDAFRVGTYDYHQSVASITPQVILNAPPVLLDIVPESAPADTVDLSGCYEEGATGCEFVATYAWSQTDSFTTVTEFQPGWGPDEGNLAKNIFGDLWKKVRKKADNIFKEYYGPNFSNTELESSYIRVGQTLTATMGSDRIHAVKTIWDVYEYEILGLGGPVGHVAVVLPQSGLKVVHEPKTWLNAFSSAQDSLYRLDHENGNILSYSRDLTIGPSDLLKAAGSQISIGYGTGGNPEHFTFSEGDYSGSSADTTRTSGLYLGNLVDELGEYLNLDGSYRSSSHSVVTTSLETQLDVDVSLGDINRHDWEYFVKPLVFWRQGALIVDYEVSVSHLDGAGPEWMNRYGSLPDPGFLLPRRYDALTDPNWNGENLYQSPSVSVAAPSISGNKPYAQVGEMVTISAEVRNFSLLECTDESVVEFYLWEDGWPSAVVIGSATAEAMPELGRAPAVSVDWIVPSWAGPEARLYARIDPPDAPNPGGLIAEIHENNNIGYTVLMTDGTGDYPSDVTDTVPWLPKTYALMQNVPNPFNPTTVIEFALPVDSRAKLRIYDLSGRLVRTLADGAFPAGFHQIRWDGRDLSGQRAASGVYLYRMECDSFNETRKLLMLR